MKKIGIVNIDTSHPFNFSRIMEENPELDMQYSMIYNDSFRSDEEVEWFKNRYEMAGRAKTIEELAENTDIGFIQSCNWDDHIKEAMPFIERGKPVFFDKPIVGSVKDVKKIRELAANGAKILGSSSARYAEEIQEFLNTPVSERGEVVTVYCESGVDEFNYGVHAGEIISEIAGAKAVSAKYAGRAVRDGNECDVYTVNFENGVIGIYITYLSGWRPFNVSIMTTETAKIFTIDIGKIYPALLKRISEYLKTGEQKTADVETLLNVTEFMLAAKRSRDFEGGKEVKITDLKEDDAFDGTTFQKEYGAAAGVMYKDK